MFENLVIDKLTHVFAFDTTLIVKSTLVYACEWINCPLTMSILSLLLYYLSQLHTDKLNYNKVNN